MGSKLLHLTHQFSCLSKTKPKKPPQHLISVHLLQTGRRNTHLRNHLPQYIQALLHTWKWKKFLLLARIILRVILAPDSVQILPSLHLHKKAGALHLPCSLQSQGNALCLPGLLPKDWMHTGRKCQTLPLWAGAGSRHSKAVCCSSLCCTHTFSHELVSQNTGWIKRVKFNTAVN